MLYTRRAAREDGAIDLHTAGLDLELSTSSFLESKNLKFNGFFLGNTSPLKSGENMAYGLRLAYPNDLWNARMSFSEVQENHDPAIGFTQRTGFRSYNPVVQFSPRPQGSRWIRRLSFGANLDLRTDMENRFLSRQVDFTVFQADLHARDTIQVHVVPNFERLERDFQIHPGITLPAGGTYSFNRYSFQVWTASNRVVAGRLRVELGDFFSGDRQEVAANLSLRPRRGVVVKLDSEWNRVSLPEGRFETRLFRAVADTQFNPWIQLSNNFQYDSVSEILAWQSRFRWILTPGNDLFIVYLHNWLDDPLDPLNGFQILDRNLAMKFVFTHRF